MGGLLEEIEQLTERINALGKRKEVTSVAKERYDIHGRDLEVLDRIAKSLSRWKSGALARQAEVAALAEYDRIYAPRYQDMKLEDYFTK